MFRLPDIEKEGELEARVGLVCKHNLFPEEKLYQYVNFIFGKVVPDAQTLKNMKKEFSPDKCGFDDIYRLKMLSIYILLNEDQFDDNFVLQIPENEITSNFFDKILSPEGRIVRPSPKARAKTNKILKKYIERKGLGKQLQTQKSPKDFIQEKRIRLKEQGESMAKRIVPKIKARLALLEILALTSLDDFIPELLKNCPRYLSCPIVSGKILSYAYGVKSGDKNASKPFEKIFSALKWKRTWASSTSFHRSWIIFQRKYLLEKYLTKLRGMESRQRKKYEGYIKYAFGLRRDAVFDYEKSAKSMASGIILMEEGNRMDEDTLKMIEKKTKVLLKKRSSDEIDLFTGRLTRNMLAENPFLPEDPCIWSIIDTDK